MIAEFEYTYYSKPFDIICEESEDKGVYTLTVLRNREAVEVVEGKEEDLPMLFHSLKTKHIYES